MTTRRFNNVAHLRQEIAVAAARIIAEEGNSYDAAKRKAARQLLGNVRITREILPDNATVEKEVRIYNELFLAGTQPARLRHLRLLCLQWMKKLESFNPYVTGAVLNGTGGDHTEIHLQLFTENVKEVEIFLLNSGIDFSVSESPHFRGKSYAIEKIHFVWQDETIHLTVYDPDDIRRPNSIFGTHSERARYDELQRLVDENPGKEQNNF